MARFVAERVVGLVGTLVVASIVIYGALYIAPGDPATLLVGGHPTPALLEQIREQHHLDDPLLTRYWDWVSGAVQLDFGQSFVYRESVSSLIGGRLGTTLFLITYASILVVIFGVGIGMLGGLVPSAAAPTAALMSLFVSIPSYAAATALISLFAINLGWFPAVGAGSGFTDQLWHMTLPAIDLALSWMAYVAQVTRAAVRREARSEHVETARMRGLPRPVVIRRHILRNAAIPITTVCGVTIAGMVAGAVVVETAFGIDGIGKLIVEAAARRDLVVVQALALLLVAMFVVVNTLVDVLNAVLDPRLRHGASTA